jgi:hypothetical protein
VVSDYIAANQVPEDTTHKASEGKCFFEVTPSKITSTTFVSPFRL